MTNNRSIAIAATMAFILAPLTFGSGTVAQEHSCHTHFGITLDPDARDAFCEKIEVAAKKQIASVMKKPKCPRSGPSSKCNPSSMPVPEDALGSLIVLDKDNSYGVTPIFDNGDHHGRAQTIARAFSDYKQVPHISGNQLGFDGAEWSLIDPEQMEASDDMQETLSRAFPYMKNSISRGATVIFVMPNDGSEN